MEGYIRYVYIYIYTYIHIDKVGLYYFVEFHRADLMVQLLARGVHLRADLRELVVAGEPEDHNWYHQY